MDWGSKKNKYIFNYRNVLTQFLSPLCSHSLECFFFLDLSRYHSEENIKERNCVNVRGFSEQLLR